MTKQMTSRERVATALNHQEPDRVPLDIGAGQSTGLVVEAYENLQAYTGITGVGDWLSKTFRVARLDDATLARLGSDVRPLQLRPPRHWQPPVSEDGTLIDEFGIKWQ
jgi:uroporphyrinogen decarboxylase